MKKILFLLAVLSILFTKIAAADDIYCPDIIECYGSGNCSVEVDPYTTGPIPSDFTISQANQDQGDPEYLNFNGVTNIGTASQYTYVCNYENGAQSDSLQLTTTHPVMADTGHSYNWQSPSEGEYSCNIAWNGQTACPMMPD